MSKNTAAPVRVKRKKVAQGAHHGGAWKVAYADFVTAMMAFFLLMWLLGATNETQRKGLADYFNPSIPVNRISGGGDGAFGGDSMFLEQTLSSSGTGNGALQDIDATEAVGETGFAHAQGEAEYRAFRDMIEQLSGHGGESMVSDLLQRHVVSRLSDDGLIVEVFDVPGAPLFNEDGKIGENLKVLLTAIAEVFRLAENEIAIEGHVAARDPGSDEASVWSRSSSRANAVRVGLEARMGQSDRIRRVTGYGDREPVTKDSASVRNNRLEIILLRTRF